jgi:hypothetical protein
MAFPEPLPLPIAPSSPAGRVRWVGLRAPWRRGPWTPEEVALALRSRRAELLRELAGLPGARGVPADALEETVDEAVSAVVMKPRAIVNEEHLRRAFWLSVQLLLARYHEGRHRVRLGSRERVDFETTARLQPAHGMGVSEEAEFKDRLVRAADFMAQLDEFEARVTAVMAIRGVGLKLAARELGVPVTKVKSAVHSANAKLEQIAVITAAGRLCDYRERAIDARLDGAASPEEVRAARAHLSACGACRKSYARSIREMRRREFQRRANAAFLPLPALAAATAHLGWTEKLGAFVGTRLPSGTNALGGGSARERVLAVLGGGAGAAKAAGVIAGAALVVVTATSGVPGLSDTHHHRSHVHQAKGRAAQTAPIVSSRPIFRPAVTEDRRSSPVASHAPGRTNRPSDGGFSYLGGNAARATTTKNLPANSSAGPAKAASLQYLGGNTTTRPTATAATSRSNSEAPTTGGQFSP